MSSLTDHLQNAIDRVCPTLTSAQSRTLAEDWLDILKEAIEEQENFND